jgi:acetamidase/formamidase
MTHHHLSSTPETVHWGVFDAAIPAVLEVDSGDSVTIDTVSGEPDDLPSRSGLELLPEHREILAKVRRGPGPHFLTGPIWVRGAMPGAVLEVKIRDIQLRQNWGFNLIQPLMGTLPDDFNRERRLHIPIDRQRGTARLPWGQEIPLRPFMGIHAVAPPREWGRITSIIPRAHGGNMDNKEFVPGTTLYLPIFNEGALFVTGDGHGVQGDGEVCLTALETSLTGTFDLVLRGDLDYRLPRAETSSHYMTMAFNEDLDDAARQALREMIDLIQRTAGLSKEDAYSLCSLGADLRITQMVDVHKGVHCMLPKSLLS